MLSDEKITAIADMHKWPMEFARAIEAEVRKQDEALIQQLVNALEPFAYEKPAREAIAAARARLEDKP